MLRPSNAGLSYAQVLSGRSSPIQSINPQYEVAEVLNSNEEFVDQIGFNPEQNIIDRDDKGEYDDFCDTLSPENIAFESDVQMVPSSGASSAKHKSDIYLSAHTCALKEKNSILPSKQRERSRSKSPMWKSGSSTYAEVLRGNNVNCTENTTSTAYTECFNSRENLQNILLPSHIHKNIQLETNESCKKQVPFNHRIELNAGQPIRFKNSQQIEDLVQMRTPHQFLMEEQMSLTEKPYQEPASIEIRYAERCQSSSYNSPLSAVDTFCFGNQNKKNINYVIDSVRQKALSGELDSTIYADRPIPFTKLRMEMPDSEFSQKYTGEENITNVEENLMKDQQTSGAKGAIKPIYSYAEIVFQGTDERKSFQPSSEQQRAKFTKKPHSHHIQSADVLSGLLKEEQVGNPSKDYAKKVTKKTNTLFPNSPSRDSGLVKRREDKILPKERKFKDNISSKTEEKITCVKLSPEFQIYPWDKTSKHREVKNLDSKLLPNAQANKSILPRSNKSKNKEKISKLNHSDDHEHEKELKIKEKELNALDINIKASSKSCCKQKKKRQFNTRSHSDISVQESNTSFASNMESFILPDSKKNMEGFAAENKCWPEQIMISTQRKKKERSKQNMANVNFTSSESYTELAESDCTKLTVPVAGSGVNVFQGITQEAEMQDIITDRMGPSNGVDTKIKENVSNDKKGKKEQSGCQENFLKKNITNASHTERKATLDASCDNEQNVYLKNIHLTLNPCSRDIQKISLITHEETMRQPYVRIALKLTNSEMKSVKPNDEHDENIRIKGSSDVELAHKSMRNQTLATSVDKNGKLGIKNYELGANLLVISQPNLEVCEHTAKQSKHEWVNEGETCGEPMILKDLKLEKSRVVEENSSFSKKPLVKIKNVEKPAIENVNRVGANCSLKSFPSTQKRLEVEAGDNNTAENIHNINNSIRGQFSDKFFSYFSSEFRNRAYNYAGIMDAEKNFSRLKILEHKHISKPMLLIKNKKQEEEQKAIITKTVFDKLDEKAVVLTENSVGVVENNHKNALNNNFLTKQPAPDQTFDATKSLSQVPINNTFNYSCYEIPSYDLSLMSKAERNYYLFLNSPIIEPKIIEKALLEGRKRSDDKRYANQFAFKLPVNTYMPNSDENLLSEGPPMLKSDNIILEPVKQIRVEKELADIVLDNIQTKQVTMQQKYIDYEDRLFKPDGISEKENVKIFTPKPSERTENISIHDEENCIFGEEREREKEKTMSDICTPVTTVSEDVCPEWCAETGDHNLQLKCTDSSTDKLLEKEFLLQTNTETMENGSEKMAKTSIGNTLTCNDSRDLKYSPLKEVKMEQFKKQNINEEHRNIEAKNSRGKSKATHMATTHFIYPEETADDTEKKMTNAKSCSDALYINFNHELDLSDEIDKTDDPVVNECNIAYVKPKEFIIDKSSKDVLFKMDDFLPFLAQDDVGECIIAMEKSEAESPLTRENSSIKRVNNYKFGDSSESLHRNDMTDVIRPKLVEASIENENASLVKLPKSKSIQSYTPFTEAPITLRDEGILEIKELDNRIGGKPLVKINATENISGDTLRKVLVPCEETQTLSWADIAAQGIFEYEKPIFESNNICRQKTMIAGEGKKHMLPVVHFDEEGFVECVSKRGKHDKPRSKNKIGFACDTEECNINNLFEQEKREAVCQDMNVVQKSTTPTEYSKIVRTSKSKKICNRSEIKRCNDVNSLLKTSENSHIHANVLSDYISNEKVEIPTDEITDYNINEENPILKREHTDKLAESLNDRTNFSVHVLSWADVAGRGSFTSVVPQQSLVEKPSSEPRFQNKTIITVREIEVGSPIANVDDEGSREYLTKKSKLDNSRSRSRSNSKFGEKDDSKDIKIKTEAVFKEDEYQKDFQESFIPDTESEPVSALTLGSDIQKHYESDEHNEREAASVTLLSTIKKSYSSELPEERMKLPQDKNFKKQKPVNKKTKKVKSKCISNDKAVEMDVIKGDLYDSKQIIEETLSTKTYVIEKFDQISTTCNRKGIHEMIELENKARDSSEKNLPGQDLITVPNADEIINDKQGEVRKSESLDLLTQVVDNSFSASSLDDGREKIETTECVDPSFQFTIMERILRNENLSDNANGNIKENAITNVKVHQKLDKVEVYFPAQRARNDENVHAHNLTEYSESNVPQESLVTIQNMENTEKTALDHFNSVKNEEPCVRRVEGVKNSTVFSESVKDSNDEHLTNICLPPYKSLISSENLISTKASNADENCPFLDSSCHDQSLKDSKRAKAHEEQIGYNILAGMKMTCNEVEIPVGSIENKVGVLSDVAYLGNFASEKEYEKVGEKQTCNTGLTQKVVVASTEIQAVNFPDKTTSPYVENSKKQTKQKQSENKQNELKIKNPPVQGDILLTPKETQELKQKKLKRKKTSKGNVRQKSQHEDVILQAENVIVAPMENKFDNVVVDKSKKKSIKEHAYISTATSLVSETLQNSQDMIKGSKFEIKDKVTEGIELSGSLSQSVVSDSYVKQRNPKIMGQDTEISIEQSKTSDNDHENSKSNRRMVDMGKTCTNLRESVKVIANCSDVGSLQKREEVKVHLSPEVRMEHDAINKHVACVVKTAILPMGTDQNLVDKAFVEDVEDNEHHHETVVLQSKTGKRTRTIPYEKNKIQKEKQNKQQILRQFEDAKKKNKCHTPEFEQIMEPVETLVQSKEGASYVGDKTIDNIETRSENEFAKLHVSGLHVNETSSKRNRDFEKSSYPSWADIAREGKFSADEKTENKNILHRPTSGITESLNKLPYNASEEPVVEHISNEIVQSENNSGKSAMSSSAKIIKHKKRKQQRSKESPKDTHIHREKSYHMIHEPPSEIRSEKVNKNQLNKFNNEEGFPHQNLDLPCSRGNEVNSSFSWADVTGSGSSSATKASLLCPTPTYGSEISTDENFNGLIYSHSSINESQTLQSEDNEKTITDVAKIENYSDCYVKQHSYIEDREPNNKMSISREFSKNKSDISLLNFSKSDHVRNRTKLHGKVCKSLTKDYLEKPEIDTWSSILDDTPKRQSGAGSLVTITSKNTILMSNLSVDAPEFKPFTTKPATQTCESILPQINIVTEQIPAASRGHDAAEKLKDEENKTVFAAEEDLEKSYFRNMEQATRANAKTYAEVLFSNSLVTTTHSAEVTEESLPCFEFENVINDTKQNNKVLGSRTVFEENENGTKTTVDDLFLKPADVKRNDFYETQKSKKGMRKMRKKCFEKKIVSKREPSEPLADNMLHLDNNELSQSKTVDEILLIENNALKEKVPLDSEQQFTWAALVRSPGEWSDDFKEKKFDQCDSVRTFNTNSRRDSKDNSKRHSQYKSGKNDRSQHMDDMKTKLTPECVQAESNYNLTLSFLDVSMKIDENSIECNETQNSPLYRWENNTNTSKITVNTVMENKEEDNWDLDATPCEVRECLVLQSQEEKIKKGKVSAKKINIVGGDGEDIEQLPSNFDFIKGVDNENVFVSKMLTNTPWSQLVLQDDFADDSTTLEIESENALPCSIYLLEHKTSVDVFCGLSNNPDKSSQDDIAYATEIESYKHARSNCDDEKSYKQENLERSDNPSEATDMSIERLDGSDTTRQVPMDYDEYSITLTTPNLSCPESNSQTQEKVKKQSQNLTKDETASIDTTLPNEILKRNLLAESNFWHQKPIYNDAEIFWEHAKKYKNILLSRNSGLLDNEQDKAKTSPVEEVRTPKLRCLFNIALDKNFWVDKCIHNRAEVQYQLLLESLRKMRLKGSVNQKSSNRRDSDEDPGNDVSRTPPDFVKYNGNFIQNQSVLSKHIAADLPGGIGSWRDQSSYLSTKNIESVKHTNDLLIADNNQQNRSSHFPPIVPLVPSLDHTQNLKSPIGSPKESSMIGSQAAITHNSEAVMQTAEDANKNLKELLSQRIEELLRSIRTMEEDIGNLPNNLETMCEKLKAILRNLDSFSQEASSLREKSKALPIDLVEERTLNTIEDRIKFLIDRATNGIYLITDAMKSQQVRKDDIQRYQNHLNEIELWLNLVCPELEKNTGEENDKSKIADYKSLLENLNTKIDDLKNLVYKTKALENHEDVQELASCLLQHLMIITELMREKSKIVETKIKTMEMQIKIPEPVGELHVPSELVEIQSVQLESPIQQKDFKKINKSDICMQTEDELKVTEDISVRKALGRDGEIIEVDAIIRSKESVEFTDEMSIEARFHDDPCNKIVHESELIIKNVQHPFETTFLEPNKNSTEVMVDANGSKHIVMKKIPVTAVSTMSESVEGPFATFLEVDQSEQSSVTATMQTVTKQIIKRTRKIVKKIVVIDGVEHITEELFEEPEEVEITEDQYQPQINVSIVRTQGSKPLKAAESIANVSIEQVTVEPTTHHVNAQREQFNLASSNETASLSRRTETADIHIDQKDEEKKHFECIEDLKEKETHEEDTFNDESPQVLEFKKAHVELSFVEAPVEIIDTLPPVTDRALESLKILSPLKSDNNITNINNIWPTKHHVKPLSGFSKRTSTQSVPKMPEINSKSILSIQNVENIEKIWPDSPIMGYASKHKPKLFIEMVKESEKEINRKMSLEKYTSTDEEISIKILESPDDKEFEQNIEDVPSERADQYSKKTLMEDCSFVPAEITKTSSLLSDSDTGRTTGYEADEKTTLDDAVQTCVEKRVRKKKRKQKVKGVTIGDETLSPKSCEENISLDMESSFVATEPEEYIICNEIVSEISGDSTYSSILQSKPVKIIEESVISSDIDSARTNLQDIVIPVEIYEAKLLDDAEQQTSARSEAILMDDKTEAIKARETFTKSSQTSLDICPLTVEMSQQTSIEEEQYFNEIESQTTVIESFEKEAQTSLAEQINFVEKHEKAAQTASLENDLIKNNELSFPKKSISEQVQTEASVTSTEDKGLQENPHVQQISVQTVATKTEEKSLQTSLENGSQSTTIFTSDDIINATLSNVITDIINEIPKKRMEDESLRTKSYIKEDAVCSAGTKAYHRKDQATFTQRTDLEDQCVQTCPAISEQHHSSMSLSEDCEIQVEANVLLPEIFADQNAKYEFKEIIEVPYEQVEDFKVSDLQISFEVDPKMVLCYQNSGAIETLSDEAIHSKQKELSPPFEISDTFARKITDQISSYNSLPTSESLGAIIIRSISLKNSDIYLKPHDIRINTVKENLEKFKKGIKSLEAGIIESTVIPIIDEITVLLIIIEQRMYEIRQMSDKIDSNSSAQLNQIGYQIQETKDAVEALQDLLQIDSTLQRPSAETCTVVQVVQKLIEKTHLVESEFQTEFQDLENWNQFLAQTQNLYNLSTALSENFETTISNEESIESKLKDLDEIEQKNQNYLDKITELLNIAKNSPLSTSEASTIGKVIDLDDRSKYLEYNINLERERLLQLQSLCCEYEETLKEFAHITLIADHLVESPVNTNTLDQLHEEMQRHRKFFVNLSHCRAILESLEENIDEKTKEKHKELHKDLYNRATLILEKAADRAQKLALAASRWTLLEKGMKEEWQWLHVAQQRVPDLSAVTSVDYDKYVALYQSLSADITYHYSKMVQLSALSTRLQDLINASNLVEECNEALIVLLRLRDEVSKYLRRLLLFREVWGKYELLSDKLEKWIKDAETELKKIKIPEDLRQQPVEHMRQFWEIKAQFEMHNNVRTETGTCFEKALQIISIADEMLQRQFNSQLEDRWASVARAIGNIQNIIINSISSQDVPIKEKLEVLENELQEMHFNITTANIVIKNDEELNLYVQRLQVFNSRVGIIESELGRIGLQHSTEPEKIGQLFGLSQIISTFIMEELENALLLKNKLHIIESSIHSMRKKQDEMTVWLDECESAEKMGSDVIEKSLKNCNEVSEILASQWHETMNLRQLLHTLPLRLRVNVTLGKIERDIFQLQDDHTVLESRCGNIMAVLRNRLNLWKRYERQLELVQQSIQETDFMMELLRVHGQVDYDRLRKATERLEGLSGELVSREVLLEDLKSSAKPLIDSCDEEIAEQVGITVAESISLWKETSENLNELCIKYQRAVKLWQQYREASCAVKNWADQQICTINSLKQPDEAIHHVKVCEESLSGQDTLLNELKGVVEQIVSDVGLETTNMLQTDIEALGNRLEHVRASIATLADVADIKFKEKTECVRKMCETQESLASIQQKIGNISEEESETQLKSLRAHLLALSKTEGQLKQLKEQSIEYNETSIVEALKLWQNIFRDTFEEYHRLSSRLICSKDSAEALKLWRQYLEHVQLFLSSSIPDEYSSLKEHHHLCEIHQNLLVSQQSVLSLPNLVNEGQTNEQSLIEQFKILTNFHNETLSRIMDRNNEIDSRLTAWKEYRFSQTVLFSWLNNQEKEKSKLNLRNIHIKRIPKLLQRMENILDNIPVGEKMAKQLKVQQASLLNFCDSAIATSIRMEEASINQRISNLNAALETWKEFIVKIHKLTQIFEGKVKKMQNDLEQIQNVLNNFSNSFISNVNEIQQQLETLRREHSKGYMFSSELDEINIVQEELKECLSPYDMKSIRQKVWLLSQRQSDIDMQLSNLINKAEERLSLQLNFGIRYEKMNKWLDALETRVNQEMDTPLTCDPEDMAKRLEMEIHSQMSFRERERDWLVSMGKTLQKLYEEDSVNQSSQVMSMDIQTKLDILQERWGKIQFSCRQKANKIHDLKITISRLEQRILDIREWLFKTELDLASPFLFESLDSECYYLELKEHERVQKSIEHESINVGEVLNLCEILFADEAIWKAQLNISSLAATVDNLEKRWKEICSASTERKSRINFVWDVLKQLSKLSEENKEWLKVQEEELESLSESLTKLSEEQCEKRSQLVEAKIEEIKSRDSVLKILEQNYAKLQVTQGLSPTNIQMLTSEYKTLLSRWRNMLPKAYSILDAVNTDVKKYHEFVNRHENIIVNLTQIDAKLTQLQHLCSPEEIQKSDEQCRKMNKIESELKTCEQEIQFTNDLGAELKLTLSPEYLSNIEFLSSEYSRLWEDIHRRIPVVKKQLGDKKVNLLKHVERDSAIQVDTLCKLTSKDAYIIELISATAECEKNLDNLEKILSESENKPQKISRLLACSESSVDLMKHLSKILLKECSATNEEAQVSRVNQLKLRFDDLQMKWKNGRENVAGSESGRLTCPLCTQRNWQQIDNDLWRLEQWLQFAESIQNSQTIPPSNIENLEDVVQDHREFLLDLESHKSIISSLNVIGDHLATHTPDTEKASYLRARLETNNYKWSNVCSNASKWQMLLQTALMGNQEFHQIIDELCAWLQKTEESIKSTEPVDLTAERCQLELKFTKLKELRSELERCEPRVISLQDAADQLLKTSEGSEESLNTYARLTDLRLRLQSLRRLSGIYIVKLGAVLGYESDNIGVSLHLLSNELLEQSESGKQLNSQQTAHSVVIANIQAPETNEMNTTVLARGYRFMGRVARASLPIQALMLLLLGVATLVPHGEDYSCIFTNNFARSLEPMLSYPNGPPPI